MNNETNSYQKILCPVDFSDASRKAFYVAVAQARRDEAELVILHVSERRIATGGYDDVEQEAAATDRLQAGLQRRLDELQSGGRITDGDRKRMTLEIGGGKPWLEIVRFAQENDVDLIVMATHGQANMKRIFIGSQAERVVRRASCAVLCVKPDGYNPGIDI